MQRHKRQNKPRPKAEPMHMELTPMIDIVFNLLIFFVLLKIIPDSGQVNLGRVFFVWVSVYNLFVVSVFWSFMADVFSPERAQRLFPAVAAGGTAGALAGPLGREERFEDTGTYIRRNTRPIVLDLDHDRVAVTSVRAHRQVATILAERLLGVDREVDEDLAELVRRTVGFSGQLLRPLRHHSLRCDGDDLFAHILRCVFVDEQTIPQRDIQVGCNFSHCWRVWRQRDTL